MAVSEFEEQLLRLKQQLGLSEDKDVAAALGMEKAAFSARKARNAFPVDKLHALHSRRPELGLDVGYVLTGRTAQQVAAELAASPAVPGKRAAQALAGDARAIHGVSAPLDASYEARTIERIRQLNAADRLALDRLLASLTERQALDRPVKRKKR